MNYIRIILIAVTLTITAFTPLWTQPNVETLTVDTLCYLGKEALGQSGGALFLPDGNIIALWWGQPLIIDSKTGEVIRKLDSCNTEIVDLPLLTPDGTKLLTRITGAQMAIWDIPTGKIIKIFNFDIGWFCISPDGQKLYTTEPDKSNDKGAVTIYDLNTYRRVERFCDHGFTFGSRIAISPDGQTLAVSVEKQPDNEYDKKTNQVILIDLKDKTKYTVLETFEPGVYSMDFSPDGKQLTFGYGGPNANKYIYICDIETKEKKYIYRKDFQKLLGDQSSFGSPKFINANILIFAATMKGNSYVNDVVVTWSLLDNTLKSVFKFDSPWQDMKDGKILLCSWFGAIAILDSQFVPVKDNMVLNEAYLQYKDNQFEYNSNITFVCESAIYDTTGKLIVSLGSQPFVIGKNIIRVNHPLQRGVYILTIKNNTSQSSYKFIVE